MEYPRMGSGPGRNTKVAIPKLDHASKEGHASNKSSAAKVRTSKACHNCRKRKVKCSGGFPCKSCEDQSLDCTYQQGRRDRLKDATDHNVLLASLLKELAVGGSLGQDDKKRVDDLLDSVTDHVEATAKSLGKRPARDDSSLSPSNSGEAHASGSVGSNEDAHHIDENLLDTHESRATGLVGQNSEIQWLHKLKRESSGATNPPIAESTFYLDGENIELDITVNPKVMPLPDTAERLFSAYMATIHSAFPILPKIFETQFANYIQAAKQHRYYELPFNVQAILNLVMAIGARYSHIIGAPWREDDRDHLVYMNRAIKLLEKKSSTSFIVSAPDLSLIQATGLLSLYYAVIGHVSRAWVIIGISIRYAFAVGLHLQNDDPSAPQEKKGALARVWWSLHSIECLLSSMTGRPCVINNEHCSVELPVPYPDELAPANATPHTSSRKRVYRSKGVADPRPYSSFFESRARIGLIMQKAQTLLYSPKVNQQSWGEVQKSIHTLTNELNLWARATFPNGAFQPESFRINEADAEMFREHYTLRFYYYSTEILVSRPCHCRLEDRIHAQSEQSHKFNKEAGESCVRAAVDITQLLPDEPDPAWLYRYGPWWSIIHNIMQAATVCLVELSSNFTRTALTNPIVSDCFRKLLLWLRAMRKNNDVANKAYSVMLGMVRARTNWAEFNLADILQEDSASQQQDHLPVELVSTPFLQSFNPSSWEMQQPIMYTDTLISGPLGLEANFSVPDSMTSELGEPLNLHARVAPTGSANQDMNMGVGDGFASLDANGTSQMFPPNLTDNQSNVDDLNSLYTYNPFLAPNFSDNMDESWGTSFDRPSMETPQSQQSRDGDSSSAQDSFRVYDQTKDHSSG